MKINVHEWPKCVACEEGATTVEYAVILGMIIIVCIAGLFKLGQGTSGLWNSNSESISSAMSGGS